MASTHQGTVTLTAATAAYSDPFVPVGARLTLVVSVANADPVTVTLQGSITEDGTYVDTAHTAATLDNTTVQIGPGGGDGTIFSAWKWYRVKVSAGGASSNVVTYLVKAID